MSKKRIHIILTERDLLIFKVLNELGFCSSENIRKIVSPNTQNKTFNIRLLLLKKHWYIKELGAKERVKGQYSIYMLNTKTINLQKIYNETGIRYFPIEYNASYTLKNHQLYLWNLFSYFLKEVRTRNNNFTLKSEDFIGSKSIQKNLQIQMKNEGSSYQYLEYVVIPDLILTIWNKIYCLELENLNSYNQFKEKILGYEQMIMRNQNMNFFPIFQWKQIVPIIACWNSKIQRYKEILQENYTGKYILMEIDII